MRIVRMSHELPADPPDTQKAARLVEYLLRLARLRTKLIRDIAEYDIIWLSDVPHEQGCFTQAWGPDEEHEPDEWLEVQHRREPELPAVPVQCKDWVNTPSLANKNDLPDLLPEILGEIPNPEWSEDSDQPETLPHTERLEDFPEVQQAWDGYVEDKWLPWAEAHNVWEPIHKIYSALFAIHQKQIRLGEEYELILGLGLLSWQTPTRQRVRRHLLVANANLEFEPRLGRFVVRPHTDGAKLRPELDMLDIAEQPTRAEEAARASLPQADDDPWENSCVEGVLSALVRSISPEGRYDDSLKANHTHASAKPVVEFAPALILRKRSTKGLIETLKRIKEQIKEGKVGPSEFADVAEIGPKNEREPSDEPREGNAEVDAEVFFPKLANEEQRRIVEKLRTTNGVLVQGPPGTGKSHTIANLIAHLLATGKRILVTAKTPRALQVLMGKSGDIEPHEIESDQQGLIEKEIRPLCISLLGGGLKERSSLESSVGGILRKKEEWSESRAKRELTELEERLVELRKEKANVNRRLRDIRESETHTQSVGEGAYRGTAARIAEAVNRDRSQHEWLTDSTALHTACPISAEELQTILIALRQFTPEKRQELTLIWPEGLPFHERFAELVKDETIAAEEARNAERGADEDLANLLASNDPQTVEEICTAFSTFQDSQTRLRVAPHPWMNDALRDILGGNSPLWHELLRVTRDAIASIEEHVEIADDTRIEFPDTAAIESLYGDACQLKKHIENGGTLGWGVFRPKTVKDRLYILKTVKIGGNPCSTSEDFSNLADALHVRIECGKIWSFWKGRSEKTEGPYSLQLTALRALCDALENALLLEQLIATCRESMKQCSGMREPVWAAEFEVERIVSTCRLALARSRKQLAAEEIQSIETPISHMSAKDDAHPLTNDLLSAIRDRDPDGFERCVSKVRDLEKQRQHLQNTNERVANMRPLLPQLTESLEQTCFEQFWDERISRIGDAWHWGQARYWVEEYIRQEDAPALAKRAKQVEDEINNAIAKLASLKAWSFCFSRLEESHRRNMKAWQHNFAKITKSGRGPQDFFHRQEAQKNLNKCRDAIPAWVMPLHRVWDTVDPQPGMFDVVIVDEASQCGFESLPLLYMAQKILVVGDDKQISPEAEGVKRDAVTQLINQFLYDFEHKASFNVNRSLFEHADLRFGGGQIVLREHFRCMPEIIRFSNDLCYRDTPLIPLRQYGPKRLPPLDHVFVSDGFREGSHSRTINRPEAEAIVNRIEEICGDTRYAEKTVGVVVLQGEAQAALIENMLLERVGAEEMESRRLVCGTPYSFQGDERDIIFLSLVAASNVRIGPLTKPADKRRFNVAASRARDMMVLYHSVTCDDLSASCLRHCLLAFFENTNSLQIAGLEKNELERRAVHDNRAVVNPPQPFDSWFEVDVALEILRKGYTAVAQHEVAGKRIDLVVEGGQARLAVECDGDHWHGADRYEADMQRQRQLERCEWEFFRVSEAAFYANRKSALVRLWEVLEEREIFPHSTGAVPLIEVGSGDETPRASDDELVISDSTVDDSDPVDRMESEAKLRTRRPDEVKPKEIKEAILRALSNCPNHSCTLDSLTARVLKEVGVRTRGMPREKFEKRTMQCVKKLKESGHIELYKAKNQRVKLVADRTQQTMF